MPVNNGFHNIPAELLRLIMPKITFSDNLKKNTLKNYKAATKIFLR